MTLTQVCSCEIADCFYCGQPISDTCTIGRIVLCDGPEIHCGDCTESCDDCLDQLARDYADDLALYERLQK